MCTAERNTPQELNRAADRRRRGAPRDALRVDGSGFIVVMVLDDALALDDPRRRRPFDHNVPLQVVEAKIGAHGRRREAEEWKRQQARLFMALSINGAAAKAH